MNLMTDLDGVIYWAYTASYILKGHMSYTQCSFDGQDFVYSLLSIPSVNDLVIVKQLYTSGDYVYARHVPGDYTGLYSGFVLIKADSDTYGYIFGARSDVDLDSGLGFTNTHNHFSKLSLTSNYPY